MPLYIVDTIHQFRMRYVVEAKSADDAMDEVTMIDSGNPKDFFHEFSQKFLGETIIDAREITKEQFDGMIEEFKNNDPENIGEECSHWMGDQLIRKIDYGTEQD